MQWLFSRQDLTQLTVRAYWTAPSPPCRVAVIDFTITKYPSDAIYTYMTTSSVIPSSLQALTLR
ncbi:uncharacterized protein AFUA_4G00130 [Aspergillus fumigatus Af293]|uniref:Uncharacterized protein n=2 Tax=Aspergillus fumigatus TaxID=746128 RepID=Q4W936_ASPFU|nr:hypothetical protein AFUA_4G00130 [Aspergillus fumigatus Af293]EAL84405.1 hypothetical protein AFUA_4G00130 [Aspergillus fumigatus Af293]EDP47071.1 hypothetical protein AFUB_100640 [Aspergillus fumigatus A1163]